MPDSSLIAKWRRLITGAQQAAALNTLIGADSRNDVDFETFERWWLSTEADQLLSEMDSDEVVNALLDVGLDVDVDETEEIEDELAKLSETISAMEVAKVENAAAAKAAEDNLETVMDALEQIQAKTTAVEANIADAEESEKARLKQELAVMYTRLAELQADEDEAAAIAEEKAEAERASLAEEAALTAEIEAKRRALDAADASRRAALRYQHTGLDMDVRRVFDYLDEDKSGFLCRDELAAAMGIFGAKSGQLLTVTEQEEHLCALDTNGDGKISFDEFEAWWRVKEVECLPIENVRQHLAEAGIVCMKPEVPEVTMRAALATKRRGTVPLPHFRM